MIYWLQYKVARRFSSLKWMLWRTIPRGCSTFLGQRLNRAQSAYVSTISLTESCTTGPLVPQCGQGPDRDDEVGRETRADVLVKT